MSSFQQWWSRDSCSLVHHSACAESVNASLPTTAAVTSFCEDRLCAPSSEYSHPPNQPSLTPPASVVIPAACSVSHVLISSSHVVGTFAPCAARTSLRTRTGNWGLTYHGAVRIFPS